MVLQADNPTSPLFIVLLIAVLIDVIFAWSGIVKGQLPNTRTSIRGARVAGVMSALSLAALAVSFYYYAEKHLESIGTVALAIAGGLFIAGILLSERIPD
jgi:hypothetical protein